MVQTDYNEVSTIILSYPERFYNGYEELTPFYDELIKLIPNNFNIWVITNNNQSIKKLEEKFHYKKINFLGLKGWDEIWLKDCLGFVTKDGIIKPRYSPSYCKNSADRDYFKRVNGLSKTVVRECLNKDILDLDLTIDGGNFVLNDSLVFLTDKVLECNNYYSKSEIESIIKDSTGLTPVIVGNNKNDTVGHIDAYLSFLDNKRAFISSYPSFPFLSDDINFINELDANLKGNGIETININERPIDEIANCGCSSKGKPCFYSARGNYINFLRLNNTIILPEYNLPTRKESQYYNKVNQDMLETLGFEVLRINCDSLAKFGGVLHCISFTY